MIQRAHKQISPIPSKHPRHKGYKIINIYRPYLSRLACTVHIYSHILSASPSICKAVKGSFYCVRFLYNFETKEVVDLIYYARYNMQIRDGTPLSFWVCVAAVVFSFASFFFQVESNSQGSEFLLGIKAFFFIIFKSSFEKSCAQGMVLFVTRRCYECFEHFILYGLFHLDQYLDFSELPTHVSLYSYPNPRSHPRGPASHLFYYYYSFLFKFFFCSSSFERVKKESVRKKFTRTIQLLNGFEYFFCMVVLFDAKIVFFFCLSLSETFFRVHCAQIMMIFMLFVVENCQRSGCTANAVARTQR